VRIDHAKVRELRAQGLKYREIAGRRECLAVKGEYIRPGTPLSLCDARRLVGGYVERYNNARNQAQQQWATPGAEIQRTPMVTSLLGRPR
jgi:hypothetical protein